MRRRRTNVADGSRDVRYIGPAPRAAEPQRAQPQRFDPTVGGLFSIHNDTIAVMAYMN